MKRPDLSGVPAHILAYINTLEEENRILRSIERTTTESDKQPSTAPAQSFAEPPTTINLISANSDGIAKRTPRHLYQRQRRGGMGIYDIDLPTSQPPSILVLADQNTTLLAITETAKVHRLNMDHITETEIRARGASIIEKAKIPESKRIAVLLPMRAEGYLTILSQSGMVRRIRHHVFGEYMKPGTPLYDQSVFGPVADACWTDSESDLFIASDSGRATRFPEKKVPPQGCQGIRLSDGETAVAIAAVYNDSNVFLIGRDGKGTIRSMVGFQANKNPGAAGKIALRTNHLISAKNADQASDIFIISTHSKLIRFSAQEVPVKEGVVQGVICVALRGDEVRAVAVDQKSRWSA